jgi:diguanylate cyclase (GGDEF)-like protein
MSISVGVATFPDDAVDAVSLVRAADDALYSAKRAGRNRVVLATALTDSSGERPA